MSTDDVFWPTRFINHRHGCDEKHSKRQPCNVPEETPVSTDDLTRRARDSAFFQEDVRKDDYTSALLSELADEVDRLRAREVLHIEAAETGRRIEEAQLQRIIALEDEVDRLRAEADRWKARSVTAGTELDGARAALERVRAIATTEAIAARALGRPDRVWLDLLAIIERGES